MLVRKIVHEKFYKVASLGKKNVNCNEHLQNYQTHASEEKFGLVSQMNRASISIPSNIAEESSRSTDKDFRRFLQIALG